MVILWLFIYIVPFIFLFVLLKTKITFEIQKARQTWLYFIEIYYVSLFFTMLATKASSNYFWLWNGDDSFESLITRFLTSYAIYQIWILVKRSLDNSADLDSFISVKNTMVQMTIALESNNPTLARKLLNDFDSDLRKDGRTPMLNTESLAVLTNLLSMDLTNSEALLKLKLTISEFENLIESYSLIWNHSFLLNDIKDSSSR